jgi:hypothetical protein
MWGVPLRSPRTRPRSLGAGRHRRPSGWRHKEGVTAYGASRQFSGVRYALRSLPSQRRGGFGRHHPTRCLANRIATSASNRMLSENVSCTPGARPKVPFLRYPHQ